MFFLLKFPVQILGLWQFNISPTGNYNIFLHLHNLPLTTAKISNFLSTMLNYKLKLYKITSNKSSKSISLIQKSNKKQRSQKGTGAARAGSLKSSISRGGGVIFGPKPQTPSLKINIKEWTCVYKSFLINKRRAILWYFINKTSIYHKKETFSKNFISHLGISGRKIIFATINKHFVYKKNFIKKVWFHNINLLNLIDSRYIIYLI